MDFQDSGERMPLRAKFCRFAVASIIFAGFTFVQVAPPSVLAQSSSGSAPDNAKPADYFTHGQNAMHAEDPLAIYRAAGIDSEQENQIHTLVKDFESESGPRMDTLHKLLKEMRELSLQPLPEESAVFAKQDEINHAQNELANARVKLLLKIRNSLKPEQREKLVSLMKGNAAPSKAGAGSTSSGTANSGTSGADSSESKSAPPEKP
jgi:Spy/CpxP family protein refolding chaperone